MRRERRHKSYSSSKSARSSATSSKPYESNIDDFSLGSLDVRKQASSSSSSNRSSSGMSKKSDKPEQIPVIQQSTLGSTSKHQQPSVLAKIYCYMITCAVIIFLYFQIQAALDPMGLSSSSTSSSSSSNSLRNIIRKKLAIIPMFPQRGEYAPVRESHVIPLITLRRAPQAEYHVLCVAPDDDIALTILTNIVMGLFDQPDENVALTKWSTVGKQYLTRHGNSWQDNNVTVVSQVMQETNLAHLQREFRAQYKRVFFLVVNKGRELNEACQSPFEYTMICFKPTELYHQTTPEEEKVMVGTIVERIQRDMPYFSKLDFRRQSLEALRRLGLMDDMMKQMRDLPTTSAETKYGIKGGTPL